MNEENIMKVTLKQISERAGVSINTVSLALRGMPNVSAQTREQILQIAGALGYFENKGERTQGKNLCLISTGQHLQDSYFYMEFEQLFMNYACSRGFNMVVFNAENLFEDPYALRQRLASDSISGLLLLGDMEDSLAKSVVECALPVVSVGARYLTVKTCTFIEDNMQAASLAVRYLKDRGCTSIGFAGDPHYSTAFSERYAGYLAALLKAHMTAVPAHQLLLGDCLQSMQENTMQLTAALQACETLPEAFFCGNDYVAIALIRALEACGQRVPEDVSIIGVDNSPLGQVVSPALTTVDVRCRRQAELSVEKLSSFVGGELYEPLRYLVPPVLIERNSVKPVFSRATCYV